MLRIAEGDWHIIAERAGGETAVIKGFKNKADVDEWLSGTSRIVRVSRFALATARDFGRHPCCSGHRPKRRGQIALDRGPFGTASRCPSSTTNNLPSGYVPEFHKRDQTGWPCRDSAILVTAPAGRGFSGLIAIVMRRRQAGPQFHFRAPMPPLCHSRPNSPTLRFASDLRHSLAFSGTSQKQIGRVHCTLRAVNDST